ncbi:MAG: ATP-dependent 6-phosphofructokinase [Candidatus Bathyarchaeia archaeon]
MRFGLATTGGDAPGMNAIIRAVVRTAVSKNIEIYGFKRGYAGILTNDYDILDARKVGGIMHLGGTFLKTSRAELMKSDEGITKASEILKKNELDGLIVIGGDGSFEAASRIHKASQIPVIGIPATIDNDLMGTDTTIGFDTAINTALDAVDKIRDTATSHERVFIVEVMGRNRGFLALAVGLASGAEVILIPEVGCNPETVCTKLAESHRKGKKSGIIIIAEGLADCLSRTGLNLKDIIEEKLNFEVRITRLGHMQRGGKPTAFSRMLACKMGAASIEFLLNGRKRDMTAIQGREIVPVDLEYACTTEKQIDKRVYEQALALSI